MSFLEMWSSRWSGEKMGLQEIGRGGAGKKDVVQFEVLEVKENDGV